MNSDRLNALIVQHTVYKHFITWFPALDPFCPPRLHRMYQQSFILKLLVCGLSSREGCAATSVNIRTNSLHFPIHMRLFMIFFSFPSPTQKYFTIDFLWHFVKCNNKRFDEIRFDSQVAIKSSLFCYISIQYVFFSVGFIMGFMNAICNQQRHKSIHRGVIGI